MRNSYRYGSYQGKRSRGRTVLLVLIAVLVVLLLLLWAAGFRLQRYMVVTDDGVRFDLPVLPASSPAPSASGPVVIATPPAIIVSSTPQPSPTPTPSASPDPAQAPIRAVLLPLEDLLDGSAEDEEGALVFDMKGEDGRLAYVSSLDFAKAIGSSASDPTLNETIAAFNAGERYTVARIVCFRDDLAPYMRNSVALRSGGGNWRDEKGLRNMSPASEDARAYLAGVCAEVAELGFDEILLDCAAFPTQGSLDRITAGQAYDPETFFDTIELFYQEIRQAMEPYPGVKLSIVAQSAALTDGEDPLSGQTFSCLTDQADRIWSPLEEADLPKVQQALEEAGFPAPEANLVALLQEPPEEELLYSWAVLALE